jgi:hypothetical protein
MTRTVDWTRREESVLFGDARRVVVDGGEGLLAMRLNGRRGSMPIHMRSSTGNSPFAKIRWRRNTCTWPDRRSTARVSACVEDLRALLAETGKDPEQSTTSCCTRPTCASWRRSAAG